MKIGKNKSNNKSNGSESKGREEDIAFLEEFRDIIDEYLVIGVAPTEDQGLFPKIDMKRYKGIINQPKYIELRKKINEMKPRANSLLVECKVVSQMVQYPAPAIGGPILRFNFLDLITDNRCYRDIGKGEFFDRIDQTIGILKNWKESPRINLRKTKFNVTEGFVFIAMPMDEDKPELDDILDSIKNICNELGLTAERVDDPKDNRRITDRIIESINSSEYVIVDLTYTKANVYYEAGYAHGIDKIPIYIARKGTEIEFDLKDYPVIFFENYRQLKTKLRERLLALKKKKNK